MVLSAAKERGKELYATLLLEERKSKLNSMISKLQEAIDSEAENRSELARDEHDATNSSQKAKVAFLIAKSDERTQALAVLMLHYLSGLQHCFDQEDSQSVNTVSKPEICVSSDTPASSFCQDDKLPSVNVSEPEDTQDYQAAEKICLHIDDGENNQETRLSNITGPNVTSSTSKTEKINENGWSLKNDILTTVDSSQLHRRKYMDATNDTDETTV